FVTATATLDFWKNGSFAERIQQNSHILASGLDAIRHRHPGINAFSRGVGMIYGLEFQSPGDARHVARRAFESGLIIEVCGPHSSVVKFLPPLNIEEELLHRGLEIVDRCIATGPG